jgi:hypothetical protein
MSNIFVVAAIISIVFFIAKFIEMRFIEKENKPLKYFAARDSSARKCLAGAVALRASHPGRLKE